jgi:hypothetical protein
MQAPFDQSQLDRSPEDVAPGWTGIARGVPAGPRDYRRRLRVFGPLLALVPSAGLGAAALALLHGSTSTARGVAGFVLAALAAPGVLVAGAPLREAGAAVPLGVMGSALGWLLLGVLASRRATRRPAASWRDFWQELAWPAAGVWAGTVLGLVAVGLLVGLG